MSDELSYIVSAIERVEDKVDGIGTRLSHVEGGIKVWKFVLPLGLTIILALMGYIVI